MTQRENTALQTAARWWYGAIAAIILGSLIIQIALLFTGGADANSGESGDSLSIGIRLWRLFSFFTIESNIVVMIVCLLLVANPLRGGPWWEVARLNALLAITITGLVYAIILAPMVHLTGWALVATIGFHYVSPWAMVLGWLLFGPRHRFTARTIAGAFILPVLWLIYIFIQGQFSLWYPYPFLDVTKIGLGSPLVNAVLVLALAAVLALVYLLIDAKVPSLLRDEASEPALAK
ncbi:Pr6Pr family membrane protein [Microbacterium sp. EST19A]|uniref:Pr6Pr family membrane protein n=1 Tax=Microbacterium sp. EST19A TaxID=2862681 RepID=UPI001CBED3BB|nr:Pr6Pr family membrane protein [Microbacterium sp. EST19A]